MSITLFLATETIQPILSPYITERGATNLELGVIISLLSFVAIAAKIPLGMLAEKIGRWPVLPAVVIGQTISLLLYSIVPNPTWFYPIRIFHALTLAAYAPTALALTHDLAPPGKRGDTLGKFLTSIGVAATLGPFLCAFMVNYVSHVHLFQLASIIPLTGLVPYLLVRHESSSKTNHEKTRLSIVGSLKTMVFSRDMLVLSYLRLAFSFANAFFITFFAIHAEINLLLTSSIVALFFGVKGITNMLSRIPSGKLADRVGYKFPIIAAFTLLAIAFLTISETRDISILILAMVIYGTAHGMRAVTEWSMLGDCAPAVAGNIATAYLSTMFNVGAAFGAVVAGALSVIFTMQTIFKIASVIVLSGVFVVNLAKMKPRVDNLQTSH